MKIVKAGYEILDTLNGEEILKKIERIARVCYKSEDKITENSYKTMPRALVNSKHYAMLEHGTIIIKTGWAGYTEFLKILDKIKMYKGEIPYIRYTPEDYSGRNIISGNLRAWLELMELCEECSIQVPKGIVDILAQEKYAPVFDNIHPNIYHVTDVFTEIYNNDLTTQERYIHMDISVKFTVDRGVSHEIVRHRKASFAQESTRYCNYGNKGGEITVIKPCFFEEDSPEMDCWLDCCMVAEKDYLRLLNGGRTPQEARAILPNSLKTEIVMTANLREWRHFFKLRAVGTTGKPHPQMLEVTVPLLKELQKVIPVIFEDLEV